ncbi:unnamed protein product [Rotaria magnacalcarata]|uniref:Uncharacterized protein n=1 Tax=Rotaria magnacalcarata TaxID=392030 RepID=A0A816N8P2_9BILA|nr:unnamed protein product [Rotaria magnacalcarata]CAF2049650.1 unnamed protein product [Rotaria magnacalcarata]CAF2104060.1 unnamed protein product [Rotaria magnacalcarata]
MPRDQHEHEGDLEEKRHQETFAQQKHELEFDEKRRKDILAQRNHEVGIEQKRYIDGLVLSLISDIGSILKQINSSLISDRSTETALVRAKTLNVVS